MSGNEDKLISVIVLSHESRATISKALHSVFMQDYARIEVIVSDDGSDDFSEDYIRDVFSSYEGESIERFLIISSDKNTGTVANLWRALKKMQGEYFTILGADDTYAYASALSDFMKMFAYRAWRSLLVTGLMEMWSKDTNTLLRTIPEGSERGVLQSEDPQQLFRTLSYNCAVPILATCFHRSFITEVDAFKRSYRYYEDYPTFLRMARQGIAPAYIDRVMIRHAAGGIANSGSSPSIGLARGLYRDRVRMWKRELDPYVGQLDALSKEKNKARRLWERKEFDKANKKSKGAVYGAAILKIFRAIKKFYSTKLVHRAALSLKLSIATMLLGAGILCVSQEWSVLSVAVAAVCVPVLLSSLWFSGLCLCHFLKGKLKTAR